MEPLHRLGGVAHTLPLGTSSQANFGHFPTLFLDEKNALGEGNFDDFGGEKVMGTKRRRDIEV